MPPPSEPREWTLAELGDPVLAFIVIGTPASQGSKNLGRAGRAPGGRPVMYESSRKVKPWRQDVKDACLRARGAMPSLDSAVLLDAVFTVPRPQGLPKTIRVFPKKRPDVDKYLRSTLDGLGEGGLFTDDARVIGFRRPPFKFYVGDPDPDVLPLPGAVIRAWAIHPNHGVL